MRDGRKTTSIVQEYTYAAQKIKGWGAGFLKEIKQLRKCPFGRIPSETLLDVEHQISSTAQMRPYEDLDL